jgi:hypothetical protein
MAASLYPLHVTPRPWHIVGLGYLTHLLVSNGFDSFMIVVEHLTRIAHFLPCTQSVTIKETASLFYRESTYYTDCPEYWHVIAIQNLSVAYGRQCGDA